MRFLNAWRVKRANKKVGKAYKTIRGAMIASDGYRHLWYQHTHIAVGKGAGKKLSASEKAQMARAVMKTLFDLDA